GARAGRALQLQPAGCRGAARRGRRRRPVLLPRVRRRGRRRARVGVRGGGGHRLDWQGARAASDGPRQVPRRGRDRGAGVPRRLSSGGAPPLPPRRRGQAEGGGGGRRGATAPKSWRPGRQPLDPPSPLPFWGGHVAGAIRGESFMPRRQLGAYSSSIFEGPEVPEFFRGTMRSPGVKKFP
ncbi:unnamed protein product, partial [Prorocentrum cordatum]